MCDFLPLEPPGDPTRIDRVIQERPHVGQVEYFPDLRHLEVIQHWAHAVCPSTHAFARWLLHMDWNDAVDLERCRLSNMLFLQPFPAHVQMQFHHLLNFEGGCAQLEARAELRVVLALVEPLQILSDISPRRLHRPVFLTCCHYLLDRKLEPFGPIKLPLFSVVREEAVACVEEATQATVGALAGWLCIFFYKPAFDAFFSSTLNFVFTTAFRASTFLASFVIEAYCLYRCCFRVFQCDIAILYSFDSVCDEMSV